MIPPRNLLLIGLLLAVGSVAVGDETSNAGWTADPALVASLSKRRPDRMVDESKVRPYTLPDPLQTSDGRRITTPEEWQRRRAELLELFRSEMFGRAPGRPDELRFEVVEQDARSMDGAATFKRVAIHSAHAGRTHRFDLLLFLPNRRSPAPLFLLMNNRNPAENTDPTRRVKSDFWPAEAIIARGYGTAVIQNNDLAPDVKTDATSFRTGIIRLFEGEPADVQAPRPPDASTAIAAWAWGASRAVDYLQTDAGVDAARVAVVGHSRGGKTALWAAAQDDRFAMAVSNNSGSCGAALSRRRFGETIAMTHTNPHWFCDNFREYHDREDQLPFDQHTLLALVAPRALYVTSATEDLWADPRGEFLGLANSSDVYALFDHPRINPAAMPPADSPLVAGPRAYHVRSGAHNLTRYDWDRFCDFADRVWK